MKRTKRFTIWKRIWAIPTIIMIFPFYLIFDILINVKEETIPQFKKDLKIFLNIKNVNLD